jgi:hypothetical protein
MGRDDLEARTRSRGGILVILVKWSFIKRPLLSASSSSEKA